LERLRQDAATAHLMRERLMPLVASGDLVPRSAADVALSYYLEHG
jgi:hypothetical protein